MAEQPHRSPFFPVLLAVTLFIGASTLLSPEKISTFRALYYLASQSENEFLRYHENKEKDMNAEGYAQTELNRSAPLFSLLYQQYGHAESLRRAIRLYRIAEKEQKYNVPYTGTNARGDITVTLTWLWNLKTPFFREKYHLYLVMIEDNTGKDLIFEKGISVTLETTTGKRIESVDLRSDPVLWEKVKDSIHSYSLSVVKFGFDGSTRVVFPIIKEPIRYAFVDLGDYGVITVPFPQNVYPDLE
jgi:hypothetical protein